MSTQIKALPFFGGTLSGFDPLDTTCTETTGANYDTNYATCALTIGPGSYGTSPTWPAASTFWMREFCTFGLPISGSPVLAVFTFLHAGTTVAQLNATYAGGATWAFQMYTLQSGVLTLVGSITRSAALNPFDMMVVGNTASGSAALYSNSTLVVSASGLNHSAWAGVDQVRCQGGILDLSPTSIYHSEIICDTSSTVGRRLRYDRLNHNSAVNTGWTGSVTNINEIPTSDSNPLIAAASNLTSTFYENGLALSNITIVGRGVSARVKREDSSGPQHVALAIRSGATNFPSTNIPATLGYAATFNSWTTDPHTGLRFTATNASLTESGVESLT